MPFTLLFGLFRCAAVAAATATIIADEWRFHGRISVLSCAQMMLLKSVPYGVQNDTH